MKYYYYYNLNNIYIQIYILVYLSVKRLKTFNKIRIFHYFWEYLKEENLIHLNYVINFLNYDLLLNAFTNLLAFAIYYFLAIHVCR